MSIALALAEFDGAAQADLEASLPGSIVLKLGANTSDSLAAAVQIKGLRTVFGDQGQQSRVQPCSVDVRKALLPEWATADSLPSMAKLITGGKTFKVDQVHDQGLTLHITAFRWPNDDD